MGAYLSAPITDKESFDEQCRSSEFNYGASSMQGWRTAQEDAHNCIPTFRKKSNLSFFAVYDGHGGPEVAKYCELYFPEFVKSAMEANPEEDLSKLIQTAFLDFDATLIDDDVVKKLKELAGKDDENEDEEDADDPVGRTETDMLKAEADMPLEELLAKYKTNPEVEEEKNKAKKLFFQSPALRGKPRKTGEGSTSNESESAASSSGMSNGATNVVEEEAGVSSSTDACENGTAAGQETGEKDLSASSSSTQDVPGASGSGCSTSEAGGSGIESSSGQRSSKIKAASDIAVIEGNASSSDDDDEEEENEEDLWEDDSSEDDDEEQEVDQDVPLMDMTNEEPGSDSGCTACVLLKQGNKVIVANAGDSRCVLSRSGTAVELSFDHKPEDDPERERIEKAGGKVTIDGRVNGGLNLSRAIGDHVYKKNKDLSAKEQMITALPDIKTAELCSDDEFLIIACDGIWNFMSSQEVIDYVSERLKDEKKREKPSLICEELFDHCLAPNILGDGTGCDNMTCILIILHPSDAPSSTTDCGSGTKCEKRKASDIDDTGDNEDTSDCQEPVPKKVLKEASE